jgi:hypothetical protein
MSQGEILRPQDMGLTQDDQRGLMTRGHDADRDPATRRPRARGLSS